MVVEYILDRPGGYFGKRHGLVIAKGDWASISLGEFLFKMFRKSDGGGGPNIN